MFKKSSYCNACAKMTLGADKIEEMIIMTENQEKKARRFPKRAALLAAALAAALAITASAAEIPAVKEFFATMFITISVNDNVSAGLTIPSVAVEEREGRTILVVDGQETDVTDELAQNGEYRFEGDGFEVVVDENGVGVVTAYGLDGTVVTYSTELADGQDVNYAVYDITAEVEGDTSSFSVTAVDAAQQSAYEIATDHSGTVTIREK